MKKRLTSTAKTLRKNSTDAEIFLWTHLRAKRFDGLKFKRQVPVGDYIADFICFDKRLVVEVDGGGHAENESDRVRDAWFAERGFKVLRFWNNEVFGNIEGVLEEISKNVGAPSPQSPDKNVKGQASPAGGEKD